MSERHELEARLRERCLRDPAFRTRLAQAPAEAIGGERGVEIPDGRPIRVVEEQPGEVVVVLPPASEDAGDMSDAELEQAAGGGWATPNTYTIKYGLCP